MTASFGPYTPVRQAGDFFFVSGQIGVHPETKIAPSDITGQTDQALQNMASALATAGLKLDDIVKATVFLTDMGNFTAMNEVYERHFAAPRPARSAIAVRELPRVGGDTPLLIEIEAVVYKETA
jgi:2-iminobutanoate/2-iminopropanoate deaminase